MDALAFLVGSWRGTGHEEYPTVDPADYEEELEFVADDAGFLVYTQRAWRRADGMTFHREAGFWRPGEGGRVEACFGHPLGLVEISEGSVEGSGVELHSLLVGRTTTGSPVVGVERRYAAEGDALRYEIAMELDEVPMAHHLRAELRRIG